MEITYGVKNANWLHGAALAGLLSVGAAFAMPWPSTESASLTEVDVFGYVIEKPRWVESSGESVLSDSTARIDGVATVDSTGFSRGRFLVDADDGTGKLRIGVAVSGMTGAALPITVKIKGQERRANVVLAKKLGCAEATCPASARVTIVDNMGLNVDIYIPASALAPTGKADVAYGPD